MNLFRWVFVVLVALTVGSAAAGWWVRDSADPDDGSFAWPELQFDSALLGEEFDD